MERKNKLIETNKRIKSNNIRIKNKIENNRIVETNKRIIDWKEKE